MLFGWLFTGQTLFKAAINAAFFSLVSVLKAIV